MDEKIKRLLNWAKGKKDLPYSIELSPTLRCNLNCLFCWRYGKKVETGDELSLEEYKKILKEAKELKVREIRIIGGGEPLIRKDTFEIMRIVKRNGMFGYICTNGTLFSEKNIKELVKIGWDHVKISFHAPTKKLQDLLAGGESFEKIVKNIKLFVKCKRKLKTSKPKLEVGLVLNKLNFRKVVSMVNLVKKLGVNAFFIEPLTVYTSFGKKLKLNKKERRLALQTLLYDKKNTNKVLNVKKQWEKIIGGELEITPYKQIIRRDVNNYIAIKEKGIKQKQLAEMVGVSPQQINKIVKGNENLTLETIAKLENALNIALIFTENKTHIIHKEYVIKPVNSHIYNNTKIVSKQIYDYEEQKEIYNIVGEKVVHYG